MSSAEAASSAAPPSPGVVQQSSITIVVPNDARGPKPRVIATTPDGQTIQADLPGAKPGERVVLMYTPLSAAAGDAEPASPRASAHEADAVAPIPSTSSSPAPAGPPHAGPPHAGPASGAGARRGSSGRGREMSIQDKLTRARKVANRRRWLVGTPRIATALLLGTLLGCLLVAWRALGMFETLPLFAAYAPLVPFAMPSVLLVLQPIDRTATRLVGHTVSATAALVVLGELFVVGVFHSSSPVRHLIDSCAEARLVFGHAAFMVISLPTLAYFAARTTPCAGCCACAGGCCCGGEGDASAAVARAERVQSKQRALLSRLWGATGVLYLAHACAGLILSACLLMHPEWTTRSGGFLVLVVAVELGLLGLVCVVQRWRRWLQRKLASRVNGDVAAAAAIADLISAAEGDTAVQDADPAAEARRVMKQAAARMRAVTLDRLTVDEFSQREGAVGMLYARSQPAKVGLIDAFVSHSWHDDAPGKWAALMAWRAEFVRKNGREPIVWLDKCCIDQTDITSDLANLPYYLASCSTLLIFAGPTYLERLWCVVELFCYTQMGGTQVEMQMLEGFDEATLRRFDARGCKCFQAEDYEKMMSFIESAFITLDAFNTRVAELLEGATKARSASGGTTAEASGSGGGAGGGRSDAPPAPAQPVHLFVGSHEPRRSSGRGSHGSFYGSGKGADGRAGGMGENFRVRTAVTMLVAAVLLGLAIGVGYSASGVGNGMC